MRRGEYQKQLLLNKIDAQRKEVRHEFRSTRSSVTPLLEMSGLGRDALALAGPAGRIARRLGDTPAKRRRLLYGVVAGLAIGLPAWLLTRRR